MERGADKDRIREAVERISGGEGTLEELDQKLEFLKRSVPHFYSSNLMLSLERVVLAKHKLDELTTEMGERLSREQLIELVDKICSGQGTEVESDAYLELVERNVPHPAVSDLIFWREERLSPEEIIDAALSYEVPSRRGRAR